MRKEDYDTDCRGGVSLLACKVKILKTQEQSSGVCDGLYERYNNENFKHQGIHGYGTV